MGLDILAVRAPVFVKPCKDATDEDRDALTCIYATEPEWADRLDKLPEGLYRVAGSERHGSWSYGGYNRLRELVCLAAFDVMPDAVWKDPQHFENDGVFGGLVALIHFSDCEGAFGPMTSRRIADGLAALDLSKIEDEPDHAYAVGGVAKLLACFRDAAEHDGFAVWS